MHACMYQLMSSTSHESPANKMVHFVRDFEVTGATHIFRNVFLLNAKSRAEIAQYVSRAGVFNSVDSKYRSIRDSLRARHQPDAEATYRQ
jgi:hypothetical protein